MICQMFFDSLSDDIKQSLQNMGVDLGDFSKLANLSFENVMGEILSLALGNISSPLKGLVNITALLFALLRNQRLQRFALL